LTRQHTPEPSSRVGAKRRTREMGFIKSGFDVDKFADLSPVEDAAERLK
jgi:hypothetical protein